MNSNVAANVASFNRALAELYLRVASRVVRTRLGKTDAAIFWKLLSANPGRATAIYADLRRFGSIKILRFSRVSRVLRATLFRLWRFARGRNRDR